MRTLRTMHYIAVLTLTMAAAGCSNPAANLATGPSGLPDTLDSHGGSGGNARYYSAQFTNPASVAAGTTQPLTMVIVNCNAGATCDGSHASATNAVIGRVVIAVPAGFTGIAVTNAGVVESNPNDNFTASYDPNTHTIILRATAGNTRLNRGDSLTVTFTATAPCTAGAPLWSTTADQEQDGTTTQFTIVGSQPSMAVTGTCVTECTVKGQGYWEHHFSDWPALNGGLLLGNRLYTPAELLSILEQNPVRGNGIIALAHQLISAKLNIAAGEDGASIQSTIAAADALIGELLVPPVGSGSLLPAQTGDLTEALEVFNEQCDEDQ